MKGTYSIDDWFGCKGQDNMSGRKEQVNSLLVLQSFIIARKSGNIYLQLPWIGDISSSFEKLISKATTSCFYSVKPRVVYNTRVMLPSAKKDSVPTT